MLPEPVAGQVDLDDRPALASVPRLAGGRHRLVQGGIELLPQRREGLHAHAGERGAQLRANQPHSLERRIVLGRRRKRPVEVVERRHQLLHELGHASLLRQRGLARHALAIVLEVGLRALGEQVDADSKERIEAAIKDVRESLESEDPAAINAKTEALQTAFHAVSEMMYQRAQQQGAAGGNGSATGGDGASSDEEDVVDAEVVDEPKA